MTSITHQKSEVKQEIIAEIERRLREKPEDALVSAVGLATSLAGRLTLAELRGWAYNLFDTEREAAAQLAEDIQVHKDEQMRGLG